MTISELVRLDNVGGTPQLLHRGTFYITAIRAFNTTGSTAYLQCFDSDTPTAIVPGTTIPDWIVSSPANDVNPGDGLPTDGLVFRHGMVVASTTALLGANGATQHVRVTIQ